MPAFPQSPVSLGRQASPEDFGAGVARAAGERSAVFDQVGQISDHLVRAADDAKLARVAAEISAGLDQAAFQLRDDPDLDTHAERIAKAGADLLKQGQDQLPPELHASLENRIFPALAHAKLEVAGNVRVHRIDDSRANLARMAELNADQAASTQDEIRRAQIRGQTVGAYDQAKQSGLVDQQLYDAELKKYDRAVSLADVRRLTRENPEKAFQLLHDPQSAFAAGHTAAERELMATQASDEAMTQLRERLELARATDAEEKRKQKERGDAATKAADDALAQNDVGQLQQILRAHREDMTPDEYRYFVDRLSGGGRAPKTVPSIYLDLSDRAARGESIEDEAKAAYRRSELDQDDLLRLQKQSEERRFSSVREFLGRALQPGLLDRLDETGKAKIADTRRQFDDWVAAHPKASGDEAAAVARQSLRDHGFDQAATLLQPTDPAQLNIDAQRKAALDRHLRGELSDADFTAEMQRLMALQNALRLQEAPK